MEKAQKIKGKVKAALFYPCAVLLVAMGILFSGLLTWILSIYDAFLVASYRREG